MWIPGAPLLPPGLFYRHNKNGRTVGGPRETVELCEYRSFLWFKWVKVLYSAGVYHDMGGTPLNTPVSRAATRVYQNWKWDNE